MNVTVGRAEFPVEKGTAMLNWTGHPLADVGVATLCVMANKEDPATLTLADLDRAAEEMDRYYFSGALASYLTCVFMNSEYVQPGSGPKKAESRERYKQRVLKAHRAEPDEEAEVQVCVFSGQPATHRIHRGQMPLLTGEGVLNFFPAGAGGMFLSGPYLTALQALPLGGRRSEGKLLVAHSDSPELTLALVKNFVDDNRRLLALTMAGALPDREGTDERLDREQASWDAVKKQPKYPDAKSAFTLIASDLMRVFQQRRDHFGLDVPVSLQVYWLSSSGQGPSLEIFTLPSGLVRFLGLADRAPTHAVWQRLIGRGWQPAAGAAQKTKGQTKRLDKPSLVGPGRSKNPVLTDLLGVYTDGFVDAIQGRRFVRRYLLSGTNEDVAHQDDCSWDLTKLFLEEVLGMSPDRIDRIRQFADTLALYIEKRNEAQFFRRMTYARYAWVLRGELVKAQRREFLAGNDLLYSLDEYLGVFEGEDGAGVVDWSLVRDLICIRLVEQLHKSQWLTPDKLKPADSDDDEADARKES